MLMHAAVRGGRQLIDRFENFIEAPLFLVAALNGNRLDGIIGFDQALRGAFEALPDDIGVNCGVDQLVEPRL